MSGLILLGGEEGFFAGFVWSARREMEEKFYCDLCFHRIVRKEN